MPCQVIQTLDYLHKFLAKRAWPTLSKKNATRSKSKPQAFFFSPPSDPEIILASELIHALSLEVWDGAVATVTNCFFFFFFFRSAAKIAIQLLKSLK